MESLHSPEALQALAAERGMIATLHPASEPMPTVEAAAAALGIQPDEMTKNVIFLVSGAPVLVISAGQSRISDRALAQHFGVGRKHVKLASPQQTWEASGFVAGCVPPFGHKEPLPTLVDDRVARLERVYGGTSDPQVLVSVPSEDLIRSTQAVVLDLSLSG